MVGTVVGWLSGERSMAGQSGRSLVPCFASGTQDLHNFRVVQKASGGSLPAIVFCRFPFFQNFLKIKPPLRFFVVEFLLFLRNTKRFCFDGLLVRKGLSGPPR